MNFYSYQQTTNLNPSEVSLEDLRRLFKFLAEINRQAIKLETEYRTTSGEFKVSEQVTEVPMPFRIEVEGTKGEYLASAEVSILEPVNLPGEVKRIKFDNSFYCHAVNKFYPMRQFNITIDFSQGPIFKLARSPSERTENASSVNVWGIDEIWVNGASKKIVDALQKRKLISRFLHYSHVYDCLLWLVLVPLSFWNLWRWDAKIREVLPDRSGALLGLGYFLTVLYFMLLLKMTLDYARWLFPYMTLKEYPRQLQLLHQAILGALILGILGSLIAGLISNP